MFKRYKDRLKIMINYLFVAGAVQDMKNPETNKTKPCMKIDEGSSGKARRRIAASGIAVPELI